MDKTPFSSSSPVKEHCEICEGPGHGVHFGVNTCRACAAFFRRTVVEKCQKRYKCIGGRNQCVLPVIRRHQCRSCRFKKCISLGMTPDNIQLDRDPEMIVSGKMDRDSETALFKVSLNKMPKKVIDVTPLVMEIQRVLNEPSLSENEFSKLSKLELAEKSLESWRKPQKPANKLKILKDVPITKLFQLFDVQKICTAKFLSHSSDFQKLSSVQKYEFFKHVVSYLKQIERFEMSTRIFGAVAFTEKNYVISFCSTMSKSTRIRFGKVTDYPDDVMKKIFLDSRMEHFRAVSKELWALKLEPIEVAFILMELAWRIAGKKKQVELGTRGSEHVSDMSRKSRLIFLDMRRKNGRKKNKLGKRGKKNISDEYRNGKEMQGDVLQLSEQVRDELADNLHDYYQKHGIQLNYAGRLIKIMKSIALLLKTHAEIKNTMELAHLFDIFNGEPSEPAFFNS